MVLFSLKCVGHPVEDAVRRNLRLENLRKAVDKLDGGNRGMDSLRYSDALTVEEIGRLCGVSKMTVFKRLKELHEKLRSSVKR